MLLNIWLIISLPFLSSQISVYSISTSSSELPICNAILFPFSRINVLHSVVTLHYRTLVRRNEALLLCMYIFLCRWMYECVHLCGRQEFTLIMVLSHSSCYFWTGWPVSLGYLSASASPVCELKAPVPRLTFLHMCQLNSGACAYTASILLTGSSPPALMPYHWLLYMSAFSHWFSYFILRILWAHQRGQPCLYFTDEKLRSRKTKGFTHDSQQLNFCTKVFFFHYL